MIDSELHEEILKCIYNKESNFNNWNILKHVKNLNEFVNDEHNTYLHLALYAENYECVLSMIRAGISYNIPNKQGYTVKYLVETSISEPSSYIFGFMYVNYSFEEIRDCMNQTHKDDFQELNKLMLKELTKDKTNESENLKIELNRYQTLTETVIDENDVYRYWLSSIIGNISQESVENHKEKVRNMREECAEMLEIVAESLEKCEEEINQENTLEIIEEYNNRYKEESLKREKLEEDIKYLEELLILKDRSLEKQRENHEKDLRLNNEIIEEYIKECENMEGYYQLYDVIIDVYPSLKEERDIQKIYDYLMDVNENHNQIYNTFKNLLESLREKLRLNREFSLDDILNSIDSIVLNNHNLTITKEELKTKSIKLVERILDMKHIINKNVTKINLQQNEISRMVNHINKLQKIKNY